MIDHVIMEWMILLWRPCNVLESDCYKYPKFGITLERWCFFCGTVGQICSASWPISRRTKFENERVDSRCHCWYLHHRPHRGIPELSWYAYSISMSAPGTLKRAAWSRYYLSDHVWLKMTVDLHVSRVTFAYRRWRFYNVFAELRL